MNDFSNIGFDYGVKPFLMLVGDLEFSELFKKAECKGLQYIFRQGENEELLPVQIAFLFQNEEPAEKFLEILLGWIQKSNNDGDAVSIDFIEKNKGGYTISISPEINRFVERMIPKNLKGRVTPILMVLNQFKEIDTLGKNYLNFKANFKKVKKIDVGYIIGTPTKIVKKSQMFFTKKEFNFFKEDEIPANSMASSYSATQELSDFDPKTLSPQKKESLEEISQRRIAEMKSFLPLTFNKLKNLWLGEIQKRLEQSYPSEIIVQAICNLTIFERLKKIENLSPDFTKQGYPNQILDYLVETYESFDSYYPPDEYYTDERIIKQIQNDNNELVTYLSK